MSWRFEEKREAAIHAPLGPGIRRSDTRVIERRGWYQLITPSSAGAVMNEIAFSQVEPEDAERVIDEAIETYHQLGLPVKWCVGPWTKPDDFGERLARRGFRSWDVRGMAASTALRIEAPSRVMLREVTEETLDEYLRTFVEGWALPEAQVARMRDEHLTALRRPERIARFFTAFYDETPAATTGLLLRERYGYFVGAQVLESFRGRGLYRALIKERLEYLEAAGRTLAVTQAREATSAPMLEHLGFETVFRSKCYQLDPT